MLGITELPRPSITAFAMTTIMLCAPVLMKPVGAHAMTEGGLTQMAGHKSSLKASIPNARLEAVRSAGLSAGAAWGYYETMLVLESQIRVQAAGLDQVFNFAPLLLAGHVLPPVIEEAHDTAGFHSSTEAAFSRVMFRIVHPARIVSATPNWRNWLLPPLAKPRPVNPVLLPETDAEKTAWSAAVKKGWAQGSNQAHSTMLDNVHRLERSMRGILLFMRLRGQGLVHGPVVVAGAPAIRIGDQTLSVDSRTFQITLSAGFSKHFRPLIQGANN